MRQRSRGGLELGRGGSDRFDDLSDRSLEIAGELVHIRLALHGDALLHILLGFPIKAELGLQRLKVSQRDADLVVALHDDTAVEQALRDFRHRSVELFEWPHHGADGL